MKVIIAGPRNFRVEDEDIKMVCRKAPFPVDEIVSGMSGFVDAAGIRYADAHRFRLHKFPADWNTYGKAAGPIRNRAMAIFADALIVVRPQGSKTRGTESMIAEANKAGISIHVEEIKQ